MPRSIVYTRPFRGAGPSRLLAALGRGGRARTRFCREAQGAARSPRQIHVCNLTSAPSTHTPAAALTGAGLCSIPPRAAAGQESPSRALTGGVSQRARFQRRRLTAPPLPLLLRTGFQRCPFRSAERRAIEERRRRNPAGILGLRFRTLRDVTHVRSVPQRGCRETRGSRQTTHRGDVFGWERDLDLTGSQGFCYGLYLLWPLRKAC